jgi:hypothetical protein
VAHECILDPLDVHVSAERSSERGDTAIGDAARDDQIEMIQVSRDVEGEAVAGDPP